MELTKIQLAMLRQPFEEAGAFDGRTEEEITKLLEGIAEIYITLAKINLCSKQEPDVNKNNYGK